MQNQINTISVQAVKDFIYSESENLELQVVDEGNGPFLQCIEQVGQDYDRQWVTQVKDFLNRVDLPIDEFTKTLFQNRLQRCQNIASMVFDSEEAGSSKGKVKALEFELIQSPDNSKVHLIPTIKNAITAWVDNELDVYDSFFTFYEEKTAELTIMIPQRVATHEIGVAEFGNKLLTKWKLEGAQVTPQPDGEAAIIIPSQSIKKFLEEVLQMRELPQECCTENYSTFYDQFVRENPMAVSKESPGLEEVASSEQKGKGKALEFELVTSSYESKVYLINTMMQAIRAWVNNEFDVYESFFTFYEEKTKELTIIIPNYVATDEEGVIEFGKQLLTRWKLDGAKLTPQSDGAAITIPSDSIKKFLEEVLQMRELPQEFCTDNYGTFYDQFVSENSVKIVPQALALDIVASTENEASLPLLDHIVYDYDDKLDVMLSLQNMLFYAAQPAEKLSPAQLNSAATKPGKSTFHPQIQFVPVGLAIRLPADFCRAGLDQALIDHLIDKGILQTITVKGVSHLRCPEQAINLKVQIGPQKIPMVKEIIILKEHFGALKSYFQLDDFVDVSSKEDQGKTTLLAELEKNNHAELLHSEVQLSISNTDKNLRSANTIGLTLATLDLDTLMKLNAFHIEEDEKLHAKLESDPQLAFEDIQDQIESDRVFRRPEIAIPTPYVMFNPLGMLIKLPEGLVKPPANEGEEQEIDGVSQILEEVFFLQGEKIDEHNPAFKRTFKAQFFVPRDDIPLFLSRLGMLDLSGVNYLADLKALNDRYYQYEPVRDSNPFVSVRESLKKLVPKGENTSPEITLLRNGTMLITLPQGTAQSYKNDLTLFLQYPSQDRPDGSCVITVASEHVESFLKHKLKLVDADGKLSILENLRQYEPFKNFEVLLAIGAKPNDSWLLSLILQNQLQVAVLLFDTIARSLASFDPETKTRLKAIASDATPPADLALPVVIKEQNDNVTIYIPEALQSKKIAIEPGKELNYGQFLQYALGAQNISYETINQMVNGQRMTYQLKIPAARFRTFLEDQLGMVDLPYEFQTAESVRFINRFSLPVPTHASWRKEGILLRNPSMPTQGVPTYTRAEIKKTLQDVLKEHPRASVWVENIMKTYDMALSGDVDVSKTTIKQCLPLLIQQLKNPDIRDDRKRSALDKIGEGCSSGTCMPGRAGKIYVECAKFHNPNSDEVTATILNVVDTDKEDLISGEILKPGTVVPEGVHIHCVLYAYKTWTDCGLDPEKGRSDIYADHYGIHHVRERHRQIFIDMYNHRKDIIFRKIFDYFNGDRHEDGSIFQAGVLRDKFADIFRRRGMKPEEIETALVPLLSSKMERIEAIFLAGGVAEDQIEAEIQKLVKGDVSKLKASLKAMGLKDPLIETQLKELLPLVTLASFQQRFREIFASRKDVKEDVEKAIKQLSSNDRSILRNCLKKLGKKQDDIEKALAELYETRETPETHRRIRDIVFSSNYPGQLDRMINKLTTSDKQSVIQFLKGMGMDEDGCEAVLEEIQEAIRAELGQVTLTKKGVEELMIEIGFLNP